MVSFYFILIFRSWENWFGRFFIIQVENKGFIILYIFNEVRFLYFQVLNVVGLGIYFIVFVFKLRLKRAIKLLFFQVKQEKMGGVFYGELLYSVVVIDVCDLIMKISRVVYGQGLF